MSNFALVTGPAGTGKSFWAKEQAEQAGTMLTATTGVAAINLGTGTTINGVLRYFDTADLRSLHASKVLHTRLRWLRDKGVKHLILDEVSMLSGHQLTCMADALHDVNLGSRPLRLTLVGDLGQLPPVNEPYAFESPAWEQFASAHTHLTEVRRQSDREFIEALGAVRRGDAAAALDYFGDKLSPSVQSSFEGTTLKARNEEVDAFNNMRLDQLEGRAVVFTSTRSGTPRREWTIIPHNLTLKIGALVMILANRREKGSQRFEYVNGDLGILEDQVEGDAAVRLLRTGAIQIVSPVERENAVGSHRTAVGSIQYMPLRLAWASTVHKAQGLSLDAVQVDIRDRFFGHPSMTYVALSRARTPGGLRIVGTKEQFRKRCVVAEKVRQWL